MKEQEKGIVEYREVCIVTCPHTFVIYKLTAEQFDKELERLRREHKYVLVNLIDGKKCIVFENSMLIEIEIQKETEPKEIPKPTPKIIELQEFHDNAGRTLFTIRDFDRFIRTWFKDEDMIIYVLNGRRMIITANDIFQEDIKTKEQDKFYV